ncbi:hypothetical protein PsYK624_079020 [Phanerochaete sordida]|uniref:Uncharacterized protein n=1 Tax=Phanerochaete sordida TaxID=48140 RepID=A0A9P3LDQ1_9APHY|nr:hypothetical protein PsYK624_079020 [Phanerochaete sordida]
MPSVLYASAVREAHDGFTLSMTARHTLNIGEEGPKVYNAKGRIPNIDILLRGDLVLCLCGIANGRPVPSSGVKSSAPAKRLHAYLSANASALGISTVSELYVDDDEVTKVNLSPSAPYEPEAGYPAAYLSTVAVTFVFYTKDTAPDGDIFTEQVFLPFGAALDRLVDKFATLHLARRYPLIFGPLRRASLDPSH